MAIFHFPVSIVSRGKGQSAVAKAAYNAREKLENEKTGELHDYTRAEGLAFSGIFAPKDAPDWVQDREKLWSEVEHVESRVNSQLARSIEIGLPHELTEEQRRQLVTDFVRENFVRKGMIADVAIHRPDRDGDERNHHAHVLLTMREIGPDGFGPKRREWNSKEQLETWRENWARTANRYLERHGHDARIDHRSLEAQGIDREATVHLGPMATQKERAGEPSERGDINRDIEARNRERERLQIEARAVGRELTEAEQARPVAERLTGKQVERLRRMGYDVLHEAAKTETKRREIVAQRAEVNAANIEKIRKVAGSAPSGLDFMIQLQEEGFAFATNKWGQYVAMAENGYCYSLKKNVRPELLQELTEKTGEGLIIPTSAQVREDRWQAARDAERKARAEERAARQKAFEERMLELRRVEVGKLQGEIRLSYTLAPSGEAFASALEEKGLILTRATSADVARSEQAQRLAGHAEGAHSAPLLNEGDYYAVSGGGYVYPLNIRTTGASKAEIVKRLGPLDQESLLSVGDAQAVMWEVREHRKEEWERERDKTAQEREAQAKTAAALSGSGSLGMESQQRAAMRRFERAQKRAASALRPMLPEEASARTEAERKARADERRSAALETTAPAIEAKERQQREHEGKERAEQTKREKESFAARKDHGQQKVSDRAARTEQTDRKQRTTQSLAEKLYGKSFQPSRIERDDNERERER